MKKRSQAALEFLMTYGWAILVVLVVIGALAYFGVLNPNILVPEKCTMASGISCKDFKIVNPSGEDNSYVQFNFENGMGKSIVVKNVTLRNDDVKCSWDDSICKTDIGPVPEGNPLQDCSPIINLGNIESQTIPNGGGLIFRTSYCDDTASGTDKDFSSLGRKTKGEIEVTYHFTDSDPSFTHVVMGELLATVQ